MGVKGLYSFLKLYRRERTVSSLLATPPLRIGVDAMSLLYKYKAAWKEIPPFLEALQRSGHRPVFIFDGKPPAEKEVEVRERRDARQDALTQANLLRNELAVGEHNDRERRILEESIQRLEHQGWHMSRDIRHEFQQILWTLKIPYVKANQEADTVLVDLAAANKIDVILSSDMDFLLSSVGRVWIPKRMVGVDPQEATLEEIILSDVLEGEGMTADQLRDAGILCGVEPLRGRVMINPHTAFTWIRYYGSLEEICSSRLTHPHLQVLRADQSLLGTVRAHFAAQAPWDARIRPDHLARVRDALEAF